MILLRVLVLIGMISALSAQKAWARRFDFKDAVIGPYVGGTIGFNKVQKTPFEGANPLGVVAYPDYGGTNYGYSGNAGLGLTIKNAVTFKLGVELLYANKYKDLQGRDSTNTPLFLLNSDVYGVAPELMIEVHFKKGERSRFHFGMGGGYLTATIRNEFTMTAQGQTTLGVPSYTEEGSGTAVVGKAFAGFEFVLTDNVTFSTQIGYRQALVPAFTHSRDAVTPNGTFAKGQKMTNAGGSNRSVDFSGGYAGFQLIFWIL